MIFKEIDLAPGRPNIFAAIIVSTYKELKIP